MATLQAPESSGFDIDELAPVGTFVATCLEVDDQFGVERPKFENPQEKEVLDVTRFLFAFRGDDGRTYRVQSFEFRISGNPKSNLFKFLTSWIGQPPQYGWDYAELKGQGAMITVAHKQSRDGMKTYANIVGISPVIAQLRAQVLPIEAFTGGQGTAPAAPQSQPSQGTDPTTGAPAPHQAQAPGNQLPQHSPNPHPPTQPAGPQQQPIPGAAQTGYPENPPF